MCIEMSLIKGGTTPTESNGLIVRCFLQTYDESSINFNIKAQHKKPAFLPKKVSGFAVMTIHLVFIIRWLVLPGVRFLPSGEPTYRHNISVRHSTGSMHLQIAEYLMLWPMQARNCKNHCK